MYVPEKFVNNEKYILQTKIDQLIDSNKTKKSLYIKMSFKNPK